MFESVPNCPLCGGKQTSHFMIIKDHFLTKDSFNITYCETCSLKYTNPRPTIESVSDYYESDEYLSHYRKKGVIGNLYTLIKNYSIKKKYDLIRKKKPEGRLLDIGCGTGDFMKYGNKLKFETFGIEPSEHARSYAINENKLTVVDSLKTFKSKQKMDVITMWHSLEHVHDLKEVFNFITDNIKSAGRVYVALPNYSSYDAKKYKEFWAAWDLPRHIFHFNQESMKYLANKMGYRIRLIVPLPFDAYYISLMSHYYQTGKKSLKESAINGWKSNNYAKYNDNNYSSLIYVLKKK